MNRRQLIPSLLVVLLGVTLRVFGLGKRSLWSDEMEHVYGAQSDIWAIWERLKLQVSPPFDYLITHLQLYFEPFSPISFEAFVRLPSCFFSVLALFFLWSEFRASNEDRAVKFLVLCGAVASAFLIFYAQECRMYSLLFLLSLLTWKFWTEKRWVGWTAINIVGIWTHYFFPLLVLTQLGFAFSENYRNHRKLIVRGLLFQIAAGLLLTPLFFAQLWNVTSDVGYQYGHAPTLAFPLSVLRELFSPFRAYSFVGSLVLLLGGFGMWVSDRTKLFLVAWAVVPLLVSWGISFLWPIATTRNLLILFYPWLYFVMSALLTLTSRLLSGRPRIREWATVVLVLGVMLIPMIQYATQIDKEDNRGAARVIASQIPEGLLLVEQSYTFAPVYLARLNGNPDRSENFFVSNWKEQPYRSVFLDSIRIAPPSAFLSRHIEPELEQAIASTARFQKHRDFAGLRLYWQPQRNSIFASPTPTDSMKILHACRTSQGRPLLLLQLCCEQREEKGPPFVFLNWDQGETEAWATLPSNGWIPRQYWRENSFSYLATLPLRPDPAQESPKVWLRFRNSPTQELVVSQSWPSCNP